MFPMETSAVTNDNIRDLTVKLGRQTCLAPRSIGKRSIDHEIRHSIVKVAVDPRGDSLVDPQTTLTFVFYDNKLSNCPLIDDKS